MAIDTIPPQTTQQPPAERVSTPSQPVVPAKRPARRSRLALLVIIALVLIAVAIPTVLLMAKWPYTRERITQSLEHIFGRPVEIGRFHSTYFPPGCVAEDIHFLPTKERKADPLITVGQVRVRTSYSNLIFRKNMGDIYVAGLHVIVPAKSTGQKGGLIPQSKQSGKSSVEVGEVATDEAVVEFRSSNPKSSPMTLNIHHLVLDHIGAGQTIDFKAALSDSKPPGEIAMNGKLGPWNSDDPASVPIHGSYTYDNADLGVFHGIGGKLSSHGKFDGTLEKIAASGVVEVPKFHVHGSSHSVPIHGEYHADILGHTGEIKIVDARAQILHTSINGAGNLSPTPGKKGRTLSLNLESTKGRIEDLLTMFQGAPHPSMSGSVNFHAHVVVPPGNEPFLRKLLWDGDFGMGGSKFHNPKTQGALNHLTESAAGEKKDQIQEDPRTFVENLRGHVTSRDGVATLSHVSFAMPGTSARMDGTYGLMSKIVDFHGTLYTDGKLSDSTTGIKSFFMKAMSPFIKKKEQTTVVPFTITGTSKTPKFALDLLHRSKD